MDLQIQRKRIPYFAKFAKIKKPFTDEKHTLENGKIIYYIKDGEKYANHIETAGFYASSIISYGADESGFLQIMRHGIYPTLRLYPNLTGSHLDHNFKGISFNIDGKPVKEKAVKFEFDGMLHIYTQANEIKIKHPQTHGFNPLHRGDEIAFINSSDMLQYGRAKIIESDLINEYEIALKLSCDCIAGDCDVIEDISACPELIFENNTVNRIITRAVLYTSRGKCIIKNNRLISNSMSGILLSDDAKSWYESGMCCDVTIEGNTFDYCGETPILIKPENKIHNGAVHKNITIKNNVFRSYSGYCIKAKSCENLLIENNTFSGDKRIYSENCDKVTKDF